MRVIVAAVGLAMFGGFQASAEVVLVSQSRTVTARVQGGTLSDAAPGFGSWNGDAALVSSPDFPIFGSGRGTQDSVISIDRISGSGSVLAQDDVQAFFGFGESNFSTTFDVTEAQPFSLNGNWTVDYSLGLTPTAVMLFQRIDSNPEVLHRSEFRVEELQIVQSGTVNLAGILTPGRYVLSMQMQLDAYLNPGFVLGDGSYSLDLQLPSPGSAALAVAAAMTRLRRRR